MKIGIDIDDVSLNFVDSFRDYCRQRNPPIKKVNEMEGHISKWFGLDRKGFQKIHEEFANSFSYDCMPLVEGFREVYPVLKKEYDAVFITARSPERKERTINCFQKQIPEFDSLIYFSSEFYGKGNTKGEVCKRLRRQVHIEDNPDYINSCLEKGVNVFLFDRPWNQNCEHENIVRVKNWKEILEKLNAN